MTKGDKNLSEKSPNFFCKECDYISSKQSEYNKHLLTAKHLRMTEKISEVAIIISCEYCDYSTSKLSDYNKHILTAKHLRMTDPVKNLHKNLQDHYKCDCGKVYKYRQGLFRHKPVCGVSTGNMEQINKLKCNLSTDIIIEMMKENQEFKSLIIEQQKENKELMNKMVEITQNQLVVPTNITNNTTTNNNNQKFNLNFFLNETCKDAMNIQEFIENIKITFEDLLAIGNTGFVNGLSDIFMKQLKDLDVTKRPIHCTDSKRETIYLKANNEWSKDDKENKQLKDAIEKVEYKNVASLHQWCAENPDSKINNTPNNLLRDKIFLQTLQGDDKTRDKIIKNIVKEVVIDR